MAVLVDDKCGSSNCRFGRCRTGRIMRRVCRIGSGGGCVNRGCSVGGTRRVYRHCGRMLPGSIRPYSICITVGTRCRSCTGLFRR